MAKEPTRTRNRTLPGASIWTTYASWPPAASRARSASAGSFALYAPTWTVNAAWFGAGRGISVAAVPSFFGAASSLALRSTRGGFAGFAGGGAVRGAVSSE